MIDERHELVLTVYGELPKSCEECIFSSFGQRFCRITHRESPNFKYKDAKCIYCRELPPHGRLIDVEELVRKYKGECWEELMLFVSNEPTVLEASED